MNYQYIVNPVTNRKVRINTRLGKRIIKNYTKIMNGGLAPGNRPLYLDLYTTLDREYRELYYEKNRVCKQVNEEPETYGEDEDEGEDKGQYDAQYEYYSELIDRCRELEYMFEWDSTENPMVLAVLKYLSRHGSEEIMVNNIETVRERATNILELVDLGYEDLQQDDIDENEDAAIELVLPILETWERFVKMGINRH